MLRGIRIYTSDDAWRQILTDLGATVLDTPDASGIQFDSLGIEMPISGLGLKSAILGANDSGHILKKIFGTAPKLPHLQSQIIVLLYKTGGMGNDELKSALGYAPGIATHTIDNAIYQLRRKYGHEFIKNENGVYKIGKL